MTDENDAQAIPKNSDVTASVVIAAFTFDRWDQLVKAVDSVQSQSRPPVELILSIDRNPALLQACQDRWGDSDLAVPVKVIANHYAQAPRVVTEGNSDGVARGYSGGGARNSGAESATGDVIVITDDDAWADPDWLKYLLAPYDDPLVVAVGGRPLPEFETWRPSWFPRSFDWIFGCAYEGLPIVLSPTPRLIGANMSARSAAFRAIGGFRAVDFDDLDMCTRLAFEFPSRAIFYEPRAIVHHFVPASRVTWHYFWTRSFLVNRDKVPAFASMGEAASLAAERSFVIRSVRSQSAAAVRGLSRGDLEELIRFGAMLIGIGLAGLGNLVGRLQMKQQGRRRATALAG